MFCLKNGFTEENKVILKRKSYLKYHLICGFEYGKINITYVHKILFLSSVDMMLSYVYGENPYNYRTFLISL